MLFRSATTLRLCKAFKETPAYIRGGRSELQSYRQGVSIGITSVLDRLIKEKEEEAEVSSSSTALVVVKEQAVVAKYGEVYATRKPTKTSVSRGTSFTAGLRDGRQVDVSRRGISGNNESTKQLG